MLVSFSQLYVEQHPLVLVHVYPPAAVLALAIPLGPVWGEDHTTRAREVAPALRCRERTKYSSNVREKSSYISSKLLGLLVRLVVVYKKEGLHKHYFALSSKVAGYLGI